jgi:DNA recombination protein RmuC
MYLSSFHGGCQASFPALRPAPSPPLKGNGRTTDHRLKTTDTHGENATVNDFTIIVSGLIGLLLGALIMTLFMRLALQRCQAANTAEIKTGTLLLEERQQQLVELRHQLGQMTREAEALREKIHLETERRATAEEKNSRIPALEETLRAQKEELGRSVTEHTALTATVAELETRLRNELENTKEKLALLDETKEQLKLEFHNVANRIFEEKSEKFTDRNQSNLNTLLTPLREQLQSFK